MMSRRSDDETTQPVSSGGRNGGAAAGFTPAGQGERAPTPALRRRRAQQRYIPRSRWGLWRRRAAVWSLACQHRRRAMEHSPPPAFELIGQEECLDLAALKAAHTTLLSQHSASTTLDPVAKVAVVAAAATGSDSSSSCARGLLSTHRHLQIEHTGTILVAGSTVLLTRS
jgi:hypothetical protein